MSTRTARTTRTSFDEIARLSRRFANVLKADGLSRGDRVAVFLSQSLELPIAHLAAFRSGLVSVPLFTLFGEDALEFRLSNSGAKAIVTDEGGWEKLAKIRDRLPDLQNIYVIGDARPRRREIVLAVDRRRRPTDFATVDTSADDPAHDHLHLGHDGKSERRAACASRACSAICRMSRCATTSCRSPAT